MLVFDHTKLVCMSYLTFSASNLSEQFFFFFQNLAGHKDGMKLREVSSYFLLAYFFPGCGNEDSEPSDVRRVFRKFKNKNLIQCPLLNWITDSRISRLLSSDIAGPSIHYQYTQKRRLMGSFAQFYHYYGALK